MIHASQVRTQMPLTHPPRAAPILYKLSHHKELAFHICKFRALKYEVVSEFLRNSFEQRCYLDVIIDQLSTRVFALTNQVQPPNEPCAEISTVGRIILQRSLQQPNISPCCVGSVFTCTEVATSRSYFCFSGWCWMLLEALPPTKARRAAATSPSATFYRGSRAANTIGRPMCADSSKSLSTSPSNPDNQFAILNAKSSNPLDSPLHFFGLPRLLSDPTPRIRIFVKSVKESSCSLHRSPDTSSQRQRIAALVQTPQQET